MGCLARTEGDLESLNREYAAAKDIWTEDDNSRTHHFYGACLYKLGCVYLDQGLVEEAMYVYTYLLPLARHLSTL